MVLLQFKPLQCCKAARISPAFQVTPKHIHARIFKFAEHVIDSSTTAHLSWASAVQVTVEAALTFYGVAGCSCQRMPQLETNDRDRIGSVIGDVQ